VNQRCRDDGRKESKGFRYDRVSWASLLAVVVLLSSCGSTSPAPAQVLSCGADRREIVSLLHSGIPTYDYNPAADLADLVQSSDLVVTGTVDNIARVAADDGSGGETVTVISTGDARILAQRDQVDASAMTAFSYASWWADITNRDPLLTPIGTRDVGYVAFLSESSSVPGGFLVRVQGLFVGCLTDTHLVNSIIEPLPSDAGQVTVAELVDAIIETAEVS